RAIEIMLEAMTFGESCHVEPVPRPTLAVMRTGEQGVEQPLIGIGRRIVDEPVDFLGSRRQADEVEVGTPDEDPPGHGIAGYDPFLLQLGLDEAVDGRAAPGDVVDWRRLDLRQRPERPELAPGLDVDRLGYQGCRCRRFRPRVRGTSLDPLYQAGNR